MAKAWQGGNYCLVVVGRLLGSEEEASLGRRALLDCGDGVGWESMGGSEGGAAGAHREECSCSGSCSCSLAAALPDAGASSLPPVFAGSEM